MSEPLPRILVVDDDPVVIHLLERFVQPLGFETHARLTGEDAVASLAALRPDVALVDLRMPGINGIDVVRAIHAAQPDCQTILMTGDASIDTAIDAIKAGAVDYLTKPLDLDRLAGLLNGVREEVARREHLLQADAEVARQFEFCGMVGRSPVMQECFTSIRRLAPHVRTVLITGETGTGKELVARAFHAMGPRRHKRLVTLNCSAVVDTLFESELFGHVRGAFTGAVDTKVGLFEHAAGGTLFLDEIGELPLALQAKLLRAVEKGEIQRVGSVESKQVDTLVIAATNRDLRTESAAGRFRSDLYYRLGVIEIAIPPLRDRAEDIPYLVAKFVRQMAERLGRQITGLTPAAERALQRAPWPGNIRELMSVIERACILTNGRILSEQDIQRALTMAAPNSQGPARAVEPPSDESDVDPDTSFSHAQRAHVLRVLEQVHGNKVAAAKALGVSRRSLYRLLDRLVAEPKADPS